MKQYSLIVALHIIGIAFLSVGVYLLVDAGLWFSALMVFLILLAIGAHLYRLQMMQVRMMRHLAESLRYDDMMLSFRSPYKNRSMEDMVDELSEAMKNFRTRVLERNEMEAWQKLIRVLTHEIMNSITPIISLSETLSEREMSEKNYPAMRQGIQTIHRRSKGLLEFVENLLESELFGYEAGAFSGAAKGGKIGLFELAHKGTIFLDEIGEIPITLQAKLLRVLQEKEIRRIGSTSVHPVDVRVISATNINIEEKIREGQFRSDLYYRLNLLDISLPPLRERKEDIQELVDAYLTRFACEMGKSIPTVTEDAARILKEHSWQGNVRELRNICERLTVLNDTSVISEELLRQLKIFRKKEALSVGQPGEGAEDSVYDRLKPRKKKKELAEELGVSRTTLWRMAKRQKELEEKQKKQG